MANELAEKKTFSIAITEKLTGIEEALPKDFNKARFAQNAVALINDNPALQKYSQSQLLAGLMKGAVLGLDFYNKECYLIPYGEQLNYQTDYKGSTKLVKKYSIRPVKDVYAEIVHEGDEFEMCIVENERKVNFKPIPFNNKPIIGAFAVCRFEDGDVITEMMSLEELENTRKHSKASNSMAWKDFTTEMYRKTVIRRLCKKIEIDFENPTQRQYFEEDTDIETDVREAVKNEIAANANQVEFEFEDAEVKPVQ